MAEIESEQETGVRADYRGEENERLRMKHKWGAGVAQSVKRLTPDFGSGHELTVWYLCWSLVGILSLPLSLPLPHTLVLPLSQINKHFKKE